MDNKAALKRKQKDPEKYKRSAQRNKVRHEFEARTGLTWIKRGAWEEQVKLNESRG